MTHTAATIAASLTRAGIPAARLSPQACRDGVAVRSLGNVTIFEYHPWTAVRARDMGRAEAERQAGEQRVLAALETLGLTAKERKPGNGIWQIIKKAA